MVKLLFPPASGGGGGGAVDSVFGRTGAVSAQSGDYTADLIEVTPAGGLASNNVQDALTELDAEKAPIGAAYVVEDASAALSAEVLTTTLHNRGAYSALPAAAKAGRLYFTTDAPYVFRDTGAAQEPWIASPITFPPSFTEWVNQGSSVVTDVKGVKDLVAAVGTPPNIRARVMAAPPTPYTIDAVLSVSLLGSVAFAGILFRESATGKIVTLHVNGSNQIVVGRFDSATTANSTATYTIRNILPVFGVVGPLVLRIQDDGANRICSYSINNGISFIQLHSVGRTDFLTADQVGWFGSPNSASVGHETYVTLLSWKQS